MKTEYAKTKGAASLPLEFMYNYLTNFNIGDTNTPIEDTLSKYGTPEIKKLCFSNLLISIICKRKDNYFSVRNKPILLSLLRIRTNINTILKHSL